MQIKIIALGTAGSAPSKSRNLPSYALVYNGEVFLFDCGEGTQLQMLKYGVNTYKTKAVFITHVHGDHVIGIAGLLRTLAINNRQSPIDIFVPKGYEDVIEKLKTFDNAKIDYKVNVHGIGNGTVYKGRGFSVKAFPLSHSIGTKGYVFEENHSLKFDKELCKKLGIKGVMFKELNENGSVVANGRKILISKVSKEVQGKKIVYASDTRPAESTVKAADGADLLIHESSFADQEKKLAVERKHSTASEAASVAKKAKAKRLLLTHISARYKDVKQLQTDAKKVFKNTEVANDGMIILV